MSAKSDVAVCAMPKPPPEPPPPPPEVKVVQIKCVPWKTMDFQLEVQLPYLSIAELETFIKARHGDPIDNLVLYKDDPRDSANKLAAASEEKLDKVGTAIFYDYYPPHDPFGNRPTAPEVYAANPLIKTSCTQEYEGQVIKGVVYFSPEGFWKNTSPCVVTPDIVPWSKALEDDPYTAKIKAAKAAAEAARIAAADAEAARLLALKDERAAKRKAKKEEAKRIAAEAKAAAEEAARIEAEKAREAAEAAAKAEQERLVAEALARGEKPPEPKVEKPRPPMPEGPIPPRVKGAARSVFLGPTSKEYFGLSTLTKDFPYAMVPKEMILSEIKEKGKISDMYVLKADVEAYDGADGQILFCMDRDEVYSDEGMVWCAKEAEKINFMASIAQGNGLPPPM